MRIAILSTIAWRTPPRHYGPWESVASNITEELVARGHDVTLYATGDSITEGRLKSVCRSGYEEDSDIIPKVWESLHIANLFEDADQYDIIHNHFDFLPLTYSSMTSTPVVTTIHGFSSPGILPVYRKYNNSTHYVSISDADRSADLDYAATVHHGIDLEGFDFQPKPEDSLLFFGRIHADKGAKEAVEIAKKSKQRLLLAGIIQDQEYFDEYIKPNLGEQIEFIGSVGPEKRNKLLGNALALLHPINFEEPFGLSVVEAMACGTPVIAFNKGSMPEIIKDGKTGFLVANVREAVEAIEKLPSLNRKNCRRHIVDNFTIPDMVDKYEAVYVQIIRNDNIKE